MRVAIVGGAGYVGNALALELIERDHDVLVYDNLMYGQDLRDSFIFSKRDCRECDPLWFENFEAVINLAGYSNDPVAERNPALNWDLNVNMAARVAHCAQEAGVKRLIYASSASVYHSGEFDIDAEVGEGFNVKPVWHYSCSKYAGEIASRCFNKMAVCVLRKGTISGPSPRMRYDLLLNTMFRSAMMDKKIDLHGGGMVWRPILSIKDAVSAYVKVLEAPESLIRGRIFNVCSMNSRVRDYAMALAALLKGEIEFFEVPQRGIARSYKVSSRQIEETLGWYPRDTAHDIASDLMLYYQGQHDYAFTDFGDPRTENATYLAAQCV